MSGGLITGDAELAALCERLKHAPVIAIDTEFLRERTYYARLCLVQVASPDEHALIDPFAVRDLGPLCHLLTESPVLKVLHSGRQDLEIFHALWDRVLTPIFDTQVAAAILGHGDQVSYASLVRDVLRLELDKAQTLTDWSQRPLTDEQVRYALDDVVPLLKVHAALAGRLAELGRGDWLEKELQAMADPALYRIDPFEAWRSVRGARGIQAPQRAVLREVAAWRETTARQRDLPRRWVLSDDALVEIARRSPRNIDELRRIRTLQAAHVSRDGEAIVAAARIGIQAVPEARQSPVPERMTHEAEVLTDLMAALVRLRAKAEGVSSGQVATRAELEAVALRGEASEADVLRDWRRALVGEDLLALREGRIQLRVRDGKVEVERAGTSGLA